MKDKSKKKKIFWQKYIVMAIYLLVGIICGILFVQYIDSLDVERTPDGELLIFIALIIVIYIAILLQMIIHEVGHLVFGLLTGYRFSSFRIASIMLVRENGKLRFKRLSLAGTGGQCLMAPPEMVDDKIPITLYNLGGSLMNLIAGLVFLGIYFLIGELSLISTIMLMLSVLGFCAALTNGIPMRLGMIDNDGYNALSLSKNREALRAFWIQLKINEQTTKKIRLKDMPKEWFEVPSDEAMENSMVAAIGVFACNRLMDEHRFEEADRLMAHLFDSNITMVGLHRNLLLCDRIYCELISENRHEKLDKMLNKELRRFMRAMKKYPSVIRTEYAYTLLAEKNNTKAETIRAQFEKRARVYPYQGELQFERELIDIANKSQ